MLLSSSGRLAVDGRESTAHTDVATAGDTDALGDAGLRILTNAGTVVGPNETPGKDEARHSGRATEADASFRD